jgi:TetR/AcrR family transcriptional regulator, regulator of biofilm formation and stress response
VRALYDRYLEATRRELERIGFDGEDEPLVRLVFAALDGIVVQLLQGGSAQDADAAIAVLREMLAERLRSRGG